MFLSLKFWWILELVPTLYQFSSLFLEIRKFSHSYQILLSLFDI